MFGRASHEALRERLGIEAPHSSLLPPVAHFNRITSARAGRPGALHRSPVASPQSAPNVERPGASSVANPGRGRKCGLPDPQWSEARSRSVGPRHCRLCHVVRSEGCIDLLSAYRAHATEPGRHPGAAGRSSAHRVAGEDLQDGARQVAHRRVAPRRTKGVLARADQEGRQACLPVPAGCGVRGHEP
jgi:hypothetical protein